MRDSSCIFHGLKCINSMQCINCDQILKQKKKGGAGGGEIESRLE